LKKHFYQANLLLIITALVWGSSFIIVKDSLELLHPMQIIASRFTLAFFITFLAYHRTVFQNWRSSLLPGIILGIILILGFTTQTIGLKYTSPSTSALLTGLNVIFVALFDSILSKKKLPTRSLLGIITATIGLTFITWTGRPTLGLGDLLTIACAVFFALHIIATGQAIKFYDPKALVVIQFAFVAIFSWLLIPSSLPPINYDLKIGCSLIYLGIFSTGLAFFCQTLAQRLASPVHTAIILSTEPAFATLFSVSLGYEPLTFKLVVGGLLIITSMILSSIGESSS
jgi:drug/metabolite transporter (DMT)-like permease